MGETVCHGDLDAERQLARVSLDRHRLLCRHLPNQQGIYSTANVQKILAPSVQKRKCKKHKPIP